MELDYAYLAENAHRCPDGKLFVFAADISSLNSEQLPGAMFLTLVARFSVNPSDLKSEHVCRVEFSHPDGSRHALLGDTPLGTMLNPVDPSGETGAGLMAKLGLVFPHAGKYMIHVSLDGREVKALPIWLNYAPTQSKGE